MSVAEQVNGPALVNWLESLGRPLSDSFVGNTNARRIRRWRQGENPSIWDVDEVLVDLDIHLDEMPDDLRPEISSVPNIGRCGGVPKGYGAKLSDDQLRVLHSLHTERRLTVTTLANEIWEQVGFASAESANWSIREGFKRLELPLVHHHAKAAGARRCSGTNSDGGRCGQRPLTDSDQCWDHDPRTRELARANGLRNSPWAREAA